MTSKCGKNKKVAYESVTDVLTTFWRLLWSITESDARQHGIYLFYIMTKSEIRPFAQPLHERKPFDVIYDVYKMKQFHWLLCVGKEW